MVTKPSLDIFTGSKNLGVVFNEQNQINVKYFEVNIPLTDTTGRTSLNALGKTRIIVIQGAHSGEGFDGATANDRLADFVYEMEQWINATVSSEQVYTDSLGVSYSVDPVDWTWNRSFSDPNRIIYTLLMKQS